MPVPVLSTLPQSMKSRGQDPSQHHPLSKCHVLYLGSSIPLDTAVGIESIQKPLAERYPTDQSVPIQGIDAWVTVFTSGLMLQYSEASDPIAYWFPIQNFRLAKAVKCVAGGTGLPMGTSPDGKPFRRHAVGVPPLELSQFRGPRFVSLDSRDVAVGTNANVHHPLFAAIIRRNTGVRVLECHCFIARSPQAASALESSCMWALGHREGWTDSQPPKEVMQKQLVISSEMEHLETDVQVMSFDDKDGDENGEAMKETTDQIGSGTDTASVVSHLSMQSHNIFDDAQELVGEYSLRHNAYVPVRATAGPIMGRPPHLIPVRNAPPRLVQNAIRPPRPLFVPKPFLPPPPPRPVIIVQQPPPPQPSPQPQPIFRPIVKVVEVPVPVKLPPKTEIKVVHVEVPGPSPPAPPPEVRIVEVPVPGPRPATPPAPPAEREVTVVEVPYPVHVPVKEKRKPRQRSPREIVVYNSVPEFENYRMMYPREGYSPSLGEEYYYPRPYEPRRGRSKSKYRERFQRHTSSESESSPGRNIGGEWVRVRAANKARASPQQQRSQRKSRSPSPDYEITRFESTGHPTGEEYGDKIVRVPVKGRSKTELRKSRHKRGSLPQRSMSQPRYESTHYYKDEDVRQSYMKENRQRGKGQSRKWWRSKGWRGQRSQSVERSGGGGEIHLKDPYEYMVKRGPPRDWMQNDREYINEKAFSQSLAAERTSTHDSVMDDRRDYSNPYDINEPQPGPSGQSPYLGVSARAADDLGYLP